MGSRDQEESCVKTAFLIDTSIDTPANYGLIMGMILHLDRHYTRGTKWYNSTPVELN